MTTFLHDGVRVSWTWIICFVIVVAEPFTLLFAIFRSTLLLSRLLHGPSSMFSGLLTPFFSSSPSSSRLSFSRIPTSSSLDSFLNDNTFSPPFPPQFNVTPATSLPRSIFLHNQRSIPFLFHQRLPPSSLNKPLRTLPNNTFNALEWCPSVWASLEISAYGGYFDVGDGA